MFYWVLIISILIGGIATAKWDELAGYLASSVNKVIGGSLTVDTPTFVVDATNNRVGIGTAVPSAKLSLTTIAPGVDVAMLDINMYDNEVGNSTSIKLQKSHGDATSPLVDTIDNDILGLVLFHGVDTTQAFDQGAAIRVQQDGAAGVKVPTEMYFETYSSTAVNANQFVLDSNSSVGIGTANPSAGLHGVVTNGLMLWEDTVVDDTDKRGRWGVQGYDSDQEPFYGIHHSALTSTNILTLGGGSALGNAATQIEFYVAADNTTTTGTKVAEINITDVRPGVDDTYYLGKNDDDTPFSWKGVIFKDTTNGKYYRLEITNGAVVATDLTD